MTDHQSTHGHDCWGWGPKHYECAVAEIARLREQLHLATVDQATAEAEANDARAEIEALRAEVERWKGQHMRDSAELRRLCQHRDEYKARAERLAEALRLIESAKDRGFGIDYARGVAQGVLHRTAAQEGKSDE